ncbi:MAG: ATP-binding protein [Gammaproteobacteria bacterium]|nr:ATP-binding protein [Gammaproteobacteria bacterium]
MAHLLRIIMINGHLGGVVELDVQGHSNICGSNASGKTTLQRLIPVFYGERPNAVVPRTRQKFDRYYLPHTDSYLVYEYRRESGALCMAVLMRSSDEGISYRLVAAPYDSRLFLQQQDDGQLHARSYADFVRHLRVENIDFSNKIDSISDYRAIIQNDVGSLKLDRLAVNRLRQDALRYSLCDNPHRLRHIEKLVSAVHAKEGKMDTLKTMLAAIFEEEGVDLPSTRIKSAQVREWVQQVRQSRRLQGLRQQFDKLDSQVLQLEDCELLIARLQPLLQQDAGDLKRQHADLEQQIGQWQGELQQQEDAYKAQRHEHDNRLSQIKSEQQQTQLTLDSIEQRFHDYELRDMPALEQAVAQLGIWRAERDGLDEELLLLREAEGSSRQRFESRRHQLQDELLEFRNQIDQQLEQVRQQENRVRDEQARKRRELEEDYQREVNVERERFNEQRLQLIGQQKEVKVRLEGSLLESLELERLDEQQARVDNAQDQLNHKTAELDRLSQEQERARREQDSHLQQVGNQRQSLQRAQQEHEELQRQSEPKAGSLRAFLQEQQPGWQQRIGKVIRAELLERTDLNPQLMPQAEASLYQLKLDLSRLELPPHARDDEQLAQALKQAMARVREEQAQLEALEKQQKLFNQASDEAARHVSLARQQAQRLRGDLEMARASLEQYRQELEQLKRRRREDLQQHLQELEQRLHQQQERQKALLREREAAFTTRKLEELADSDEQLGRLKESYRQHEQNLQARQRSCAEQIQQLEKALKQELLEQGIDPERVSQLEAKLRELRQRIRSTEERSDELKSYQEFIRVDWQQRKPQLVASEYELHQQRVTLEETLRALSEAFDEQRKHQQQRIKDGNQHSKVLQQQLDSVQKLLRQLEQLPQLPPVPEGEPLQSADCRERIARMQQALAERSERAGAVSTALQQFERELIRDSAADFMDTWQQQLHQLGEQPPARALLQGFAGMLRLLDDQQQNLIQQGRNYGGDLYNFFTVFRDLNRRISEQSRRLSAEVTEEFALEGIGKSEVRIQSTIDELGFWQPLKAFSALHQQWEQHPGELPPESYLKQLGDVAELLRSDQQFSFESLIRLELHLNEGGADLVIRNDRQLLESSSHGMAYLILCKYLLAFTRLLRGEARVTIHWPIDEIGTLAYHNVEKLFAACANNNIYIVGAFPNPESDVLTLFRQRYLIERKPGQPAQLKRIEPQLSRLSQLLQQQRQEVTP